MSCTHTEYPWAVSDAALAVRGDDLDGETVTARLGLSPTRTRVPGPDRWDPEGDEAGLWLLKVQDTELSLPEQVAALLDIVEPRADALRELADEGYDVALTVFGFVGAGSVLELPPRTLARIVALGLPLELAASISER